MILSRQPRDQVRTFFITYQDRIMYGTDFAPHLAADPDEHPLVKYVRWNIDTYKKEYEYYAGTGTTEIWGDEVACLGLPKEVLEKLFHRNALRLISGLAQQ